MSYIASVPYLRAHRERAAGAAARLWEMPLEKDVPSRMAAQPMPLRAESTREMLCNGFASADTKCTPTALTLSSVLIRAFIEEARHRAEAVAREEGDAEVTDEHLEKILPQLLLDFGP